MPGKDTIGNSPSRVPRPMPLHPELFLLQQKLPLKHFGGPRTCRVWVVTASARATPNLVRGAPPHDPGSVDHPSFLKMPRIAFNDPLCQHDHC